MMFSMSIALSFSLILVSLLFDPSTSFKMSSKLYKRGYYSDNLLKVSTSTEPETSSRSSSFQFPSLPFPKQLNEALGKVSTATSFVFQNPLRTQYAVAMALRVVFFITQGVGLSFLLTGNNVKDTKRTPLSPSIITNAIIEALVSNKPPTSSFLENDDGKETQLSEEGQINFFRNNFVAIIELLRLEMNNIEKGVYKMPYDLNVIENPNQYRPDKVVSSIASYATDRRKVMQRQDTKDGFEVRKTFSSTKYPEYYLQNFHYQTDGWLSSESAELYDYQVESLFLGTADAMRRQILPSFVDFMTNKDPLDVKVLDIASGTGRFISFVLDNYPTLDTTVLEASPFYLQEAKKTLKKFDHVQYVESIAENMPFESNTFDAITCVYLFHELPSQIRVKVVKEMNRVLKDGGKIFFVDSVQRGEVPDEAVLEGFTRVAHEPYYLDYTNTDLVALFEQEGGFEVEQQAVHWVSKRITAVKKRQL